MVQNRRCDVLHELRHQAGYRFHGKGPRRRYADRRDLRNRRGCQGVHPGFARHHLRRHIRSAAQQHCAEVDELLDRDLAGQCKEDGRLLQREAYKELPHVKEVRHQGLLVGVEFDDAGVNAVEVKHDGTATDKLLITAIGSQYDPHGTAADHHRRRL